MKHLSSGTAATCANFVPVADLEVYGLRSRFRTAGIGAPLAANAAVRRPRSLDRISRAASEDPGHGGARGRRRSTTAHHRSTFAVRLDLHSDPDPQTLSIGSQKVPLEREQTATIAAMLADSPIWKQELQIFLGGVTNLNLDEGRLVATRPHHPGRIPVVFVHGTYSSPGRWAEMVNVLDNDPRLHARFEPWFFFYNSSNPIIYSSYLLRKNLIEAVKQMDPTGGDTCLRDMVVIGHSQGGLLTKMTVVDSGDSFWRNASKKPFEEVQMKDELREMVRQIAFVEPLPFVHRVVFISTPHRGSYLASRDLVRRLIASLVSLPKRVTNLTTALASTDPSAFAVTDLGTMTAIDNMSPKHRFVKTLAGLPIAPGVVAHSIIPVKARPRSNPATTASSSIRARTSTASSRRR